MIMLLVINAYSIVYLGNELSFATLIQPISDWFYQNEMMIFNVSLLMFLLQLIFVLKLPSAKASSLLYRIEKSNFDRLIFYIKKGIMISLLFISLMLFIPYAVRGIEAENVILFVMVFAFSYVSIAFLFNFYFIQKILIHDLQKNYETNDSLQEEANERILLNAQLKRFLEKEETDKRMEKWKE